MTGNEPSPLLERERELAALTAGVQAATSGSGRLLLVEGAAGIGKSSLLAAAAELAAETGCEVLLARCDVLDATIGYAMVRQLFERLLTRATKERRDELLAGSAAWAAPPLGLADLAHLAADESTSRHGLYWLAANLSEQAPLVLVVDDAQWCDESSLRWLAYLASRLDALALTVLIGVRSGEIQGSHPSLEALAAVGESHILRPTPLSVAATEALLELRYAEAVETEFASACHDWTGGNPMLLAELALELEAEGVLPQVESIDRVRQLVPDRVRRITLLRISRLPEAAIQLVRALAVFGEVAQLRELSALAGLADDEAERAADLLIECNLVERELPLRFTHPLIRGVVYSDLLPARRAKDHKRAAQILFSDGSAHDRVAAHLLRSSPAGDPWVVERLLEAASASLERGSASAAATMYARASTEPPPPELRWRVLHELGRAQMQAHDFGAVDTLQQAIAGSQDARQHADSALLLGRLLLYAGQPHDALGALDSAIAALDPDDERTLELEATVIAAARLDHELLQVAEDRTEARRRQAGVASYGGRMLSAQLAYQAVISGAPVAEGVALARAALGDGELIRQSPGRPDAYVVAISMLAISDELDEAETLYAEAVAAAATAGRAVDFAIVCGLRCWTNWARARLRDAELQARDALAIASESPELMAAVGGFATGTLANVLLDLGELEQAEAILGPDRATLAASSASSARDLLFASARLCALRGRWSEAASQLEACGELHERARIVNPALVPWRSELALVRHTLGDAAGARALVNEELALAQRFGARRPIGVALRAAGMIEGGDSGLQMLEQAATELERSPAQLEGIRSAVALGGTLRRTGQRVRAREVLRGALDRATRNEAALLADEAGRELAMLGSRPHSPLLSGVGALTPAERRVAEMAAEGLTNRQIAQALFVTRATIESQLHATYRKLGIGSREQLTGVLEGDYLTS